jgi:hypothetical protein
MPDVWVISQKGSPPGVYPTPILVEQWQAWKTALLTAGLWAKLFNNDFVVSNAASLENLVETTSPGYAPIAVTVLNGPFQDIGNNAYMTSPELTFTNTGGGEDQIYGAYLCKVTGAAATATFTLSGGAYTDPVITSGGSGYEQPPRVTITGATGAGAIITAQITDGVVTGITIVNGGTAYTTVTVSIEPPLELIDAGNLPAPLPFTAPTQAVQVVFELDNVAAA